MYYLDPNMNLVKEVINAAVWNIKLLNIESQIIDAESGILPGILILKNCCYFLSLFNSLLMPIINSTI